MYLVNFTTFQTFLEHLQMGTFGDSDDKILLFNDKGPTENQSDAIFVKIRSQKTFF